MADETKDGGPAFPGPGRVEGRLEHDRYGQPLPGWRPYTLGGGDGMSLRDYFAAAALTGLLASDTPAEGAPLTRVAYRIADMMLADRSRR